jgi:hypothetical protein
VLQGGLQPGEGRDRASQTHEADGFTAYKMRPVSSFGWLATCAPHSVGNAAVNPVGQQEIHTWG